MLAFLSFTIIGKYYLAARLTLVPPVRRLIPSVHPGSRALNRFSGSGALCHLSTRYPKWGNPCPELERRANCADVSGLAG